MFLRTDAVFFVAESLVNVCPHFAVIPPTAEQICANSIASQARPMGGYFILAYDHLISVLFARMNRLAAFSAYMLLAGNGEALTNEPRGDI